MNYKKGSKFAGQKSRAVNGKYSTSGYNSIAGIIFTTNLKEDIDQRLTGSGTV